MDSQDQDRNPRSGGPIEPKELREILEAALRHSDDANERLTRLFENLVPRRTRWAEEFAEYSDADWKEFWSLLKRASEQSYKTNRRLHELLDEYQRIIERTGWQHYLFSIQSVSASAPPPTEYTARTTVPRSYAIPGPSPREFITAELERSGTDGLSAELLSNLFMQRFARRSVKPEGLWATTISRMLKAGEIRQEDRDDGRWYFLREPMK